MSITPCAPPVSRTSKMYDAHGVGSESVNSPKLNCSTLCRRISICPRTRPMSQPSSDFTMPLVHRLQRAQALLGDAVRAAEVVDRDVDVVLRRLLRGARGVDGAATAALPAPPSRRSMSYWESVSDDTARSAYWMTNCGK